TLFASGKGRRSETVMGGSHGIGRATPSRRADTDTLRSIVCIFNEDVLRSVKASRQDHGNESSRPRVQSPGGLMPRTVISGLVCITFLMLLEFSAVPQEPARRGADADTESGQLTFNNACRTCHTTTEGDTRLGPTLHNIIGRKAGSLPNYGYSSAMKGAEFAHYQLSGYVALLIFEHCGELALLRNRGLGPLAVTVCPIALARTAAATACAGVQSTAPLFRRQRPARCSVHHRRSHRR